MNTAKEAVQNFTSKGGHHKTTHDESVNKAVTEEQVRPHRHEEITTAVDKEVHQDHHHTTVQPVQHKETLPEKHTHNAVPVQHKTIHHGNDQHTKDTLDREQAKFKDSSKTHDTTHSSTAAPIVQGERVHHHVHEHVQPVIQKETIQPHVVHTTVPIHETHHNEAIHHGTTVKPTQTLDQFVKEKGSLGSAHHHKHNEFDGCPDKIDKGFADSEHRGVTGSHGHGHEHGHSHGAGAAGATGSAAVGGAAVAAHKHHEHEKNAALGNNHNGSANAHAGTHNNVGNNSTNISTPQGIMQGTHPTPQNDLHDTKDSSKYDVNGKKISIVDKLNPFKDADGDGKKGIMS